MRRYPSPLPHFHYIHSNPNKCLKCNIPVAAGIAIKRWIHCFSFSKKYGLSWQNFSWKNEYCRIALTYKVWRTSAEETKTNYAMLAWWEASDNQALDRSECSKKGCLFSQVKTGLFAPISHKIAILALIALLQKAPSLVALHHSNNLTSILPPSYTSRKSIHVIRNH